MKRSDALVADRNPGKRRSHHCKKACVLICARRGRQQQKREEEINRDSPPAASCRERAICHRHGMQPISAWCRCSWRERWCRRGPVLRALQRGSWKTRLALGLTFLDSCDG